MGGAGQIHLGYGAVIAIGAYTSVHLVRFGVPLEFSMLAGGVASAVIGVVFGFAALRVKSLYLAMATIAMQYIVDFAITHIPGISGGGMASIEVPPVRFLGVRIEGDLPTYYMALLICAVITLFLLNVTRALNAQVVDHPFMSDFSEAMAQKIWFAPSVFNYFSPGYRAGALAAPEVMVHPDSLGLPLTAGETVTQSLFLSAAQSGSLTIDSINVEYITGRDDARLSTSAAGIVDFTSGASGTTIPVGVSLTRKEFSYPGTYKIGLRIRGKHSVANAALPDKVVMVRVNALGTSFFTDDIAAVATARVDVVNLPMVEDVSAVHEAARLIERYEPEKGHIRLLVNIETPKALRKAHELAAAHPRVMGLQVGYADLFEPFGIDRLDPHALAQVRLAVRLAAAEAGVAAYDGVYARVNDIDGFRRECEAARALGFAGKSCIHPTQIATANAAFMPPLHEVDMARKIVSGLLARIDAPHDELRNEFEQALDRATPGYVPYGEAESYHHVEVDQVDLAYKGFELIGAPGEPVFDVVQARPDHLVARLALTMKVRAEGTFSFSAWDSIDKDYVGLGSSNAEVDVDLDARRRKGEVQIAAEEREEVSFGVELHGPTHEDA